MCDQLDPSSYKLEMYMEMTRTISFITIENKIFSRVPPITTSSKAKAVLRGSVQ